jgi:hypothetical protein
MQMFDGISAKATCIMPTAVSKLAWQGAQTKLK